jgi:hypothetical protein
MMDTAESTGGRPPQGITIRHMATGDRGRDFRACGEYSVPRIDPECFGGEPFLALPMQGEQGRFRIKQFPAAVAADRLERECVPGWAQGIRLATDAEVAAHQVEDAARVARERAEKEARTRAAEERSVAEQRRAEQDRAAIRRALRDED